ncbi:MAG: DNA mismatch repair endonuclease MutL [Clostridiales Family XIII bacterium]|jgi:DNA mismatch repair protein MutL|nr:DNA mismatch repair endonuclease MutL [Clostridiales Family XIII bacterium]
MTDNTTHGRGKIKLLPKYIFDKIAAGEVVTGPLSVVKELVENAIDAGAAAIEVEIAAGGTKLIRVSDDGCGIDPAEIELAFTPHATSKIDIEADLERIGTLGFRGEALASIAAVSRLEMTTKQPDAKAGVRISIEGGEIVEIAKEGAADGTLVTITDLFYNTPARLKFLRSERTESSAVIDFISRIAVAYPRLRVKLVNNDNVLFATNGSGDRKRAILTVYGFEMDDLLETEAASEDDSIRLTAYLSGIAQGRKSRRGQTLFVNGRYVQDKGIQDAVSEAYREYMTEGRFPIVFLFLEVDPARLDVNVHPAKSEIRFADHAAVSKFVSESLKTAISTKLALPKIMTPQLQRQQKREEFAFYSFNHGDSETDAACEVGTEGKGSAEIVPEKYSPPVDIYPETEIKDFMPVVNIEKLLSTDPLYTFNSDFQGNYVRENVPAGEYLQQEISIDSLSVLGACFDAFLIATDADNLYLIDQHAAHERVNYERFLRQYRTADKYVQQLLTPVILQLPLGSGTLPEDWAAFLTRLSFEAEIFGQKELIVKTFPAFLSFAEADTFLRDIIEDADQPPPMSDRALERLISRACKRAVKAGDRLDSDEVRSLLRDLAACENPLTCPHGRPVFVRLSRYDVDKMFRRV